MWQIPPKTLTLGNNEVHIWRTNLDLNLNFVEELQSFLSEDEKIRAEKFYFPKHRNRYIVGRGVLRLILAQYLGIKPTNLKFEYTNRGKPYLSTNLSGNLSGNNSETTLEFNLSHSQEIGLYGFTWQRKIGVDLEFLRPMPDADKIAKRFFSPKESNLISSIFHPKKQQTTFFQIWTAKEAYLKATGDGLGGCLDQFEVSLIPDMTTGLIEIKGDKILTSNWYLYHFMPLANYVATIAVESQSILVQKFWNWSI